MLIFLEKAKKLCLKISINTKFQQKCGVYLHDMYENRNFATQLHDIVIDSMINRVLIRLKLSEWRQKFGYCRKGVVLQFIQSV